MLIQCFINITMMDDFKPKKTKMDETSIITQTEMHEEKDTFDQNAPNLEINKCNTKPNEMKETCQFFIKRKQRNCKLTCSNSQQYCVEHSYEFNHVNESTGRKRILCPMDSKHSCYEDQLERHLKKCNAREDLRPVYFEENINTGEINSNEGLLKKVAIQDLSKEELFFVLEKCKSLYLEHEKYLNKKEILFHPCLREIANDPQNGAPALKHINQQASLIGHMDRMGLLKEGQCYVEFGAGKGGLSHWVQLSLPKDSLNNQFVLVDRSCVRYKMDMFHRSPDKGPSFERLKIDIQHLNLDSVSNLDNDRPIVSIGKHLCGNATDFMLRCLVKTITKKNEHKRYIQGINLAMCCHHRCDWRSYVGKQFILDSGFTPEQFHIMCSMTSWACCGNKTIEDKDYNHPFYGSLRPQDREEIGFQVKRLIELGRVKYLQDNGFSHVELVHFVEQDCTPENVCLLAVKDCSKDCEK